MTIQDLARKCWALLKEEETQIKKLSQVQKKYWLHYFRAQEIRQFLSVLINTPDPIIFHVIAKRYNELKGQPKYCGENHHKHYLKKLEEL